MCLSVMQAERRQVVPTPPMLLCCGRPHSEPLMAVVEFRAYVVGQSSAKELERHVQYRKEVRRDDWDMLLITPLTQLPLTLFCCLHELLFRLRWRTDSASLLGTPPTKAGLSEQPIV